MIRSTLPDDAPAILAIAAAIGFQSNELEQLRQLLAAALNAEREQFWLTDVDDNQPVGMAYCEPERMTDRTWNLQLIAIRPDHQGQGRGTALLRSVEQALAGRDGRMLLVETSGLPEFDRARAFYGACGFEEEARIRDFYAAGEDKVVFRKALSAV